MKKIETAYLFAVATMLLVVVILSLHRCSQLKGLWPASIETASMGKPRLVNVEMINLLMHQGKLSDKEAKFYTTKNK
jgi:hypothetical protein